MSVIYMMLAFLSSIQQPLAEHEETIDGKRMCLSSLNLMQMNRDSLPEAHVYSPPVLASSSRMLCKMMSSALPGFDLIFVIMLAISGGIGASSSSRYSSGPQPAGTEGRGRRGADDAGHPRFGLCSGVESEAISAFRFAVM